MVLRGGAVSYERGTPVLKAMLLDSTWRALVDGGSLTLAVECPHSPYPCLLGTSQLAGQGLRRRGERAGERERERGERERRERDTRLRTPGASKAEAL